MHGVNNTRRKWLGWVALGALLESAPLYVMTSEAVAEDEGVGSISMFVMNSNEPFVSSGLAEKLGALVLTEKYPKVRFSDQRGTLVDAGAQWEATFDVQEWPEEMRSLSPLLRKSLTIVIRKKDAAVLEIK